MESKTNTSSTTFRSWFRGWLERRGHQLEEESHLRTRLREAAKFDSIGSRIFAVVVAAIASGLLFQRLTPLPLPEMSRAIDPNSYNPISKVNLVESVELPGGNGEIRRQEIGLPEGKELFDEWRKSKKEDSFLWYSFDVQIPERFFDRNTFSVLIPKIWGSSEVYLNGRLADFGRDNRPVYALFGKTTHIDIKVSPKSNDNLSGIQAIYPPVWGKIERIREFPKIVDAFQNVSLVAEALELIAALFFSVISIFSGRKPEIVRFVWFVVVNFLYGKMFVIAFDNQQLFGHELCQFLLIFLGVLRSLFAFWFFVEFSRYLEKRNQKYVYYGAGAAGAFTLVTLLVIRIAFPSKDLSLAFEVSQELAFFLVTSAVAIEVLSYLQLRGFPLRRRLATLFLYLALAVHFSLDMHDYWFEADRMTTEFSHSIGLMFLLVIVITAEFSRQEKERDEFLENFPKEEQRKISSGKSLSVSSTHVGFVLLIDAVSWSRHQEELGALEREWEFQDKVNRYLLKTFYGTETSVLAGTGDGFYFAWEGAPSLTTLREIAAMLDGLLERDSHVGERPIEFRAALAYGEYAIGRSRFNDLTRDFATGTVLNRLSQIIGHERRTLRILASEPGKPFSEIKGCPLHQIQNKHGENRCYFELSAHQLLDLDREDIPGVLSERRGQSARLAASVRRA